MTYDTLLIWMLIIPFAFWAFLALVWTPKHEQGRLLAVIGCGTMAFAWWGLQSIPGVITGAVLFLCGLTTIITGAVSSRN